MSERNCTLSASQEAVEGIVGNAVGHYVAEQSLYCKQWDQRNLDRRGFTFEIIFDPILLFTNPGIWTLGCCELGLVISLVVCVQIVV